MQAVKGEMNTDKKIYSSISHLLPSSQVQVVENQCGPIFLSALKVFPSDDKVNFKSSQKTQSNVESANSKSTVSQPASTFKNSIQGFETLKGNVTICNSRVQSVIINNHNISRKKTLQEKIDDLRQASNNQNQNVTSNNFLSIPKINSSLSTSISTRPVPKVVMSTVSKRVPLISTIGNYSKAPAFAAAVLSSSVTSPTSTSVVVSNTQSNDTVKTPTSILQTRLTSAVSNEHSLQNGQVLMYTVSAPSEGKPMGGTSFNCVKSFAPKVASNMNDQENKLSLLEKQKIDKKPESPPLAVLSYEKGLTRLVPIKEKSVVLVDVGVQVVMPNSETLNNTIMEKASDFGASSLSAVESGTPSATQGTPIASLSSTSPLKPGQFVAVNRKTGKMMFAIPKHLLKDSSGPKTVLINGKPLKLQMKGSTGSPGASPQPFPVVETSNSATSNEVSNAFQSCDGKELNHAGPLQNQKQIVPFDASLCTSIATFSDTTAPSMNSPSVSNNSEFSASVTFSDSVTISPTTSTDLTLATPVKPSSNFSLPSIIDSSSVDCITPNVSYASLSTETLTTASSQSPLSLASSFQDHSASESTIAENITLACSHSKPNLTSPIADNNSLVLPFTSPVQSPSKNALVHTIPNTTSLFILLPNSPIKPVQLNAPSRENRKRPNLPSEDSPPSKSTRQVVLADLTVNGKAGDGLCLLSEQSNQVDGTLQHMPISEKENHQENCASLEIEMRNTHNEHLNKQPSIAKGRASSSSKCWNTMDTIMNIRPSTAGQSVPLQITNMIENAFIDYKNCLVPNKDGNMPIHVAVEEGNEVAVKQQCIVLAARKASVNLCNRDDETPLQIALLHGYSSIVEFLLSRGADATVVDKEENSTLHLAILHANYEALQALLQSGQFTKSAVDCYNDEGLTPLHIGAQLNKVKEVTLLVKFGCEIDKPDAKSGRTALYHAIERSNDKVQRTLLRLGADMREPTFFGSTPLFAAKSEIISHLSMDDPSAVDEIATDHLVRSKKFKKRKRGNVLSSD